MHQLYPQFATPQQGGGYQQQDANELFTELIREFASVSECESTVAGEKAKVPVKRFVEGEYKIRMKNLEDEEEPVQESRETFMQVCSFKFFQILSSYLVELFPRCRNALPPVRHLECIDRRSGEEQHKIGP
jgi:hypothetical protein